LGSTAEEQIREKKVERCNKEDNERGKKKRWRRRKNEKRREEDIKSHMLNEYHIFLVAEEKNCL
jgi:hypothetical protein